MKFKPFRLLRVPAIAYLSICGLVGGFQRWIIYFPSHRTEAQMLAEARDSRCEPWRDASGAIIGWRSVKKPNQPPAPNRLLVFHGNTGYALQRTHYIRGFEHNVEGDRWEVTLFEYPDYGARAGSLGETSFIKAGQEAMNQLLAEDHRPIYLLGESLGSGLACALAKANPDSVAGLFLFTPYARISDVGANKFPFLPIRLMVLDPWDNVAALKDYRGPLAMLVAGEDEIVSAAQGRLLFASYQGPKRMWTEEDAGHNSVNFGPDAAWWNEVTEYLLARGLRPSQ